MSHMSHLNTMKIIRSTFAALALSLGLSSFAWAGNVVYHGSLCNPAWPNVSKVGYNQFGARNDSSSSPAVVHCGTATSIGEFGSRINSVSVVVYDRHPQSNVTCGLKLTDIFGNALWSGIRSSSGFGSAAQELTFIPNAWTFTIHLECSIPAATGGGVNNSHVTAYSVRTP